MSVFSGFLSALIALLVNLAATMLYIIVLRDKARLQAFFRLPTVLQKSVVILFVGPLVIIDDGWLKRISHPSLGALYERTGKGHHHHFHCRERNRAFELPGCALKEDKIAPSGFVVEDHEVFLFGICPCCVR
jgi:hypothetical protein